MQRNARKLQKMANDSIILLPGEIILYILEDKHLDFLDVVNFSSTCKSLYQIINNSNELWKTKFFERWPLLKEIYQSTKKLDDQVINWKEEIKASLDSRRKLLYYLSLMSSKHYKKQELCNSEFKEFDPLFQPGAGAHPLAYYFLVDELISLIKQPAMGSNLTHRYYALKVVRYIKQSHLKLEWQKFISLPLKQQTLERGATIVAQWSQPEKHVSYLAISTVLDNIAEQVKELLREKYPTHSIFSIPAEKLTFWKNNILDDNQWDVTETRQVTDALCTVLFGKLFFYGNSEMYYSLENSFIDCVLECKRGIPITLAVVFESVARRLGIHCEPVSFPSHFLLRWKETYNTDAKDMEKYYIDVFNGGKFLTKKNCPRIGDVSTCPIEKYNVHEAATAVEVVMRMVSNLEIAARQHTHMRAMLRSAHELRCVIQPNDASTILLLARIYMLEHMDLTELGKMLENMQEDASLGRAYFISQLFQALQTSQQNITPEEMIEPKRRVPEVKYAIGMIMKHKLHGYLCVIAGWDARCMAPSEWIEVNVEELNDGADQPFYNILVDNGPCHYVAQENLLMAPNPGWVNHHRIGMFFCKFNGTHYVPNVEKAREYPEDETVQNELLAMYVQNSNSMGLKTAAFSERGRNKKEINKQ